MICNQVQQCLGAYLDNPLNTHTRLSQYANNVLAALLRLVRNATLDQVALCVRGDLSGDKDLRACDDGLGLFRVSAWRTYSIHALVVEYRCVCRRCIRMATRLWRLREG